MARKQQHSIRSDSMASVSASTIKRAVPRAKGAESVTVEMPSVVPLKPRPAVNAQPIIDHEAVARLAYSYWEARGSCGGSAEEDWLRAEQELRENQAVVA